MMMTMMMYLQGREGEGGRGREREGEGGRRGRREEGVSRVFAFKSF